MTFEIVSPILGFEDIKSLRLSKIDDCFALAYANNGIEWTLVNPYILRNYTFELPSYAEILLEINKDSSFEVYCMVILQNPLQDSKVNFLAPLIFNYNSLKAIQLPFSMLQYPEFSKLESLHAFIK